MDNNKAPSSMQDVDPNSKKIRDLLEGIAISDSFAHERSNQSEDLMLELLGTVVELSQKYEALSQDILSLKGISAEQKPPVMAPMSPVDQNQKTGGSLEELSQQLGALNDSNMAR